MLKTSLSPLDEWTRRTLGVTEFTREAIERWQLDRLRETLERARKRSPFYARLYRDAPVRLPDSLRDLASLPFVTETDVREQGLDLLCVSQGDIERVVTLPTSGTTGAPKRIFFTEDDLELTIDYFHHGMIDVVEPGGCVLVLMPGERPGTVGALLRTALQRSGVDTIVYGFVDDPDAVVRIIQEHAVDCLVATPGQTLALARSGPGRLVPTGRLKSVLLSGDYVALSLREGIEQAWGCDVFDHYGSTEMGLGGAVQCRAFAGRHIRESDLLFEIIDPGSGRVLADGENGEIVLTTLTREGMPLIRYRTGDEGRVVTDACPCGSLLRSLGRIAGRQAEAVDLGQCNVLTMPDLDEVLFGFPWVSGFAASVVGDGSRSRLEVKIEASEGAPAHSHTTAEQKLRALPAIHGSGTEVNVCVATSGLSPWPPKRSIEDTRRPA